MIGMKPKDAIKLDNVLLDKKYPEETVLLPEDGLYWYLYQAAEQHGDQKRRAADLIWSKNTYRLDRIVQEPGIVQEELMHISEDTQVPPDWVNEWK